MNALASSPQTRKCCKSLRWAPPIVCLPCVYLMSPHMTRSPRPSLVIFAYCKRSKTGGGTSLWNTATVVTTLLQQFAATTHIFCRSHAEGIRVVVHCYQERMMTSLFVKNNDVIMRSCCYYMGTQQ